MSELLYFDDFTPGQTFAFGDHVLTADEIIAFAHAFDPQPQHTDPEAAKQGILGGLAASGWHLCALAMRMIVDGLLARSTSLGAPGVDEVQWRRAVRAGDRLRMQAEVLATRASASKPDRGFVTFRFDMLRTDQRVMFFTTSVIFLRKDA